MNRTEYYAIRHAIKAARIKDRQSYEHRRSDAAFSDDPRYGPSSVIFTTFNVDAVTANLSPIELTAVTARPSARQFRDTIQTARTMRLRGRRPGIPYGDLDLNKRVAIRAALKRMAMIDQERGISRKTND